MQLTLQSKCVRDGKLTACTLILFSSFFLFSNFLALAAEPAVNWRYTVRPGDNLIKLGKTHLLNPADWTQVQQINHIKNPYKIPVGTVLTVPIDLVKKFPTTAEVILVSGDAQLQTATGIAEALKVRQQLAVGSTITTKEKSKVVIQFADGTQTTVDSNAELKLNTMYIYSGGILVDTKLTLQKGQVKTTANPAHVQGNRLQIETPSAIAAVRGTEFRVSADGNITTQETLDGKVSVSASGAEVHVDKGFGTSAKMGKPPAAPVPLLAAVDTKKLKSQYNTIPLEFDLPALDGAVSYTGQLFADTTFSQVLAEARQQGSRLSFADLPDGPYFLSVRAQDKNGISGYDAVHAFMLSARPFGPEGMSPEPNVRLRSEPPTLKWNPAPDAKAYLLQVATDAEFKQMLTEKRLIETHFKLDENLPSGEYFWRLATIAVATNGQDKQGPAVKVNRFTYKAPPPAPDLSQLRVEVRDNAVFVTLAPPLEGLHYQVELDNPRNRQSNVWTGKSLNNQFSFLLKEYGQQILRIKQVDGEGDMSRESVYQFDAEPQ
jgi:hypothetical protein